MTVLAFGFKLSNSLLQPVGWQLTASEITQFEPLLI
jgi:hypothetical protein